MANRMFNQFQGTMEKGVVQLFAEIKFGAAGAPTLVRGKGIKNIDRWGAGGFFLETQDNYNRILGASFCFKSLLSETFPAAPFAVIDYDWIALNDGPGIDFKTYNLSGVATDPASGETLFVTLLVSNSTAP